MSINLSDHQQNRLELTTRVISTLPIGESARDDRASVICLESLMQPETANRCGDRGWINGEYVSLVTKSTLGQVRHHHDAQQSRFHVGQQAHIQVDSRWRDCQSRLLCLGRLVELIAPNLFPELKPISSDFRQHCAKIEFGTQGFVLSLPDSKTVLCGLRKELDRCILLDLPVITEDIDSKSSVRQIQFGDFPSFLCSGIYPRTLKRIGKAILTRVVHIEGKLQIRYRVAKTLG